MKELLYIGTIVCLLSLSACNEFLDKKQDIKMVVPQSIEDATHLLNDYGTMNMGYPIWGELGIDDYYVTKEVWESSMEDYRNAYNWADRPYTDVAQWQRPYKAVYYANQTMDVLSKVDPQQDRIGFNRNLGAAHFFRAFAFQVLTEVHCPAYQTNTATAELGIPLRLTPGMDDKSTRATLQQTYEQILKDFKGAVQYLPIAESVRGRPSKASAYAGLARAYLNMGDFNNAYQYADSCLQLRAELMDFNFLKATDDLPIKQFNVEVLIPISSVSAGPMSSMNAIIEPELYNLYAPDDLRKRLFFRPNPNQMGAYNFKGSYNENNFELFMGITTSEIYLVKAEAACRTGKISEALSAINTLRKSRWSKDVTYPVISESDPERLLGLVLEERRKELVFRARRWTDLKRLNLDDRFKKTVFRQLGAEQYDLPAGDLRYAFRLSEALVRVGSIPQNKR
ncbi:MULTISPECIES: RagB/SusD family nutrient uptake outer membrane protein [Sphingobacterium]|uniref:RagB/SusD family nutrient uptake outer membrane protein n=1 Tax=Sphingobacterium TaxID=28453 RepID=UPI0013DB598C|nr:MULTISPECIES: RagB/SusD family nutrient uptake outer membrane protein [unclassified Sphingobacterium]